MKLIKAYDNKPVKLFTYSEINKALKDGTAKQVFEMAIETTNLVHWQDSSKKIYKGLNIKHYSVLRDKLNAKLGSFLQLAGYHFDSSKQDWFNTSCYSIDDPSQRESRILAEEFALKAFDAKGNLKSHSELIKSTSAVNDESIKSICVQISSLDLDQLRAFLEFVKDTGIDYKYIQDIEVSSHNCFIVKLYNREYTILTERKAEELARESLEDGEYWEECVKAGRTEQSKEDWIDDVLNSDGWASQLNSYDGSEEWLYGDWHYFRSN